MTKKEFDALFDVAFLRLQMLRDAKHDEYANEADTFQNLINGGRMLDIHPALYAFILKAKQENSLHGYALELTNAEGTGLNTSLAQVWEKTQDCIVYHLIIYGLICEHFEEKLSDMSEEASDSETDMIEEIAKQLCGTFTSHPPLTSDLLGYVLPRRYKGGE